MVNVDKRELARPQHNVYWNPSLKNALKRLADIFWNNKKIKIFSYTLFTKQNAAFFFKLNTLILSFTD